MSNDTAIYENQGYEREAGETVVSIIYENVQLDNKERLTYSWEYLNVFAPVTQGGFKKKQVSETHILRNVTGICRPGELLAVMGASGAGKTTLMNCLNFRSDASLKIQGKLYANGKLVTPDLLTSRSAYVQQDDIFVGTITVREQLVFQANLRMDNHISRSDRMQRVEDVIIELNLVKCADTLIGIPGTTKGISGGETKRLAFACEVLTDPPIMFCDEPTTGLDSFMAQNIVEVMRNLADKGKTIITTIHQPSSEVFALFNRVLLMTEGRTAFLGSTDEAIDFFAGMGKICPEDYNPADFFIGLLAIKPDTEEDCKHFVEGVCDAFERSSLGQEVTQLVKNNSMGEVDGIALRDDEMQVAKSPYKAGWLAQFREVFKRSALENIRNRMVLRMKLIQVTVIALIIGMIYFDQEMNQQGIQNLNGALFLILTQLSFSSTMVVIKTFCAEVPLFLREHFNGMYRTDVYFLAKNVAEFPLNVIQPVILVSISYYMVGFNPMVDRFFIHMAIMVLIVNTVASFGFFISCMAKDERVGTGLAAPLIIPLMLFGGLFLNANSMPVYFIWIRYISWFFYGFEDLVLNQWDGITNITCPDRNATDRNATDWNATDVNVNISLCVTDGDEVIERLGFDKSHMVLNIGMLFALLVGFRLFAFLLLLLKTSRKAVKSYEKKEEEEEEEFREFGEE